MVVKGIENDSGITGYFNYCYIIIYFNFCSLIVQETCIKIADIFNSKAVTLFPNH